MGVNYPGRSLDDFMQNPNLIAAKLMSNCLLVKWLRFLRWVVETCWKSLRA